MIDFYIAQAQKKMEKNIDHLGDSLSQLRGSQATTALLDHIKVEVYGQSMPIKAVANVSTPDPKTILISPWDKTNGVAITKAITEDTNLGLTPNNDGTIIRLNLPPLTQERRQQLLRSVSERLENCKVSLRAVRHEILNEARRDNKDKQITDDQLKSLEDKLNKLIEQKNKQADQIFDSKKTELLEV